MKEDFKRAAEKYKDPEEYDFYVKKGLRVLHGVLWEPSDWGYHFEKWTREAWAKEFDKVVKRVAAASSSGAMKGACPSPSAMEKCNACASGNTDCLFACVAGKGLGGGGKT